MGLDGIQRPLSSLPATLEVKVRLTPESTVHHVEVEVRSIAGNLLAASSEPGGRLTTPDAVISTVARLLRVELEDALGF